MNEKLPMTADGLAKLKSELENLKNSERPNIIKAIAEAREHGDLSENAEYHAAREKQSFIEGRISELENKISRAEVIDISSLDNSKITFGATVKITDLAGDGNHYAAEVIDESFRGKNRVQQQRIVYSALKGKMDGSNGELHALALTTKIPEG